MSSAAAARDHVPIVRLAALARTNRLLVWLRRAERKTWLVKSGTRTKFIAAAAAAERKVAPAAITHTFLDAPFSKMGPISVPRAALREFYTKYAESVAAGDPLYVVEKADTTKPRPLLVDIDLYLRQAESGGGELKHREFEHELLREVARLVDLCFGRSAAMYVQAADAQNVRKRNEPALRLGTHLFWPELLVDNDTVQTVRRYLVHGLASAFPTERLLREWNAGLLEDWTAVVDKSVCTNVQLRLPGSRKLVRQKCECVEGQVAVCYHSDVTYEKWNARTKSTATTTETWYESSRLYSLHSVWRSGSPDEVLHRVLAGSVVEMCMHMTLLYPEGAEAAPLQVTDEQVPDTMDDRSRERGHRKRTRAADRTGAAVRGLTDAEFAALVAANLGTGPQTVASDSMAAPMAERLEGEAVIRASFFSVLAMYFPEDAANVDARTFMLDGARYASVIVREMFCENKGGFHGDRRGRVVWDMQLGTVRRGCFCGHIESLGRMFGGCKGFHTQTRLTRNISGGVRSYKSGRDDE